MWFTSIKDICLNSQVKHLWLTSHKFHFHSHNLFLYLHCGYNSLSVLVDLFSELYISGNWLIILWALFMPCCSYTVCTVYGIVQPNQSAFVTCSHSSIWNKQSQIVYFYHKYLKCKFIINLDHNFLCYMKTNNLLMLLYLRLQSFRQCL